MSTSGGGSSTARLNATRLKFKGDAAPVTTASTAAKLAKKEAKKAKKREKKEKKREKKAAKRKHSGSDDAEQEDEEGDVFVPVQKIGRGRIISSGRPAPVELARTLSTLHGWGVRLFAIGRPVTKRPHTPFLSCVLQASKGRNVCKGVSFVPRVLVLTHIWSAFGDARNTGTVITGKETFFMMELAVGDAIVINHPTRYVLRGEC
jgi:hypothetical protein